jgi:predicted nucleic acid-binding protein
MIAADTSSLVAYFAGAKGKDVDLLELALETCSLILPPVVLSELLSDATMPANLKHNLLLMPLIPVLEGYWARAGHIRSILVTNKLKARLADTLIAQSCIDAKVALITRDDDFRHFASYCKLTIA